MMSDTKSKIMYEDNAWDIVLENIPLDTACELEHAHWHDNYWNIISSQIKEDLDNV